MGAPHSLGTEIQDLVEISCLGVSIYGSSHGSLKRFPVVTQYSHIVHGIKSKLTDLNRTPNEMSEMTVNCVMQILKEHSLLTNFVVFCGDNMNTNFGGIPMKIKMSSMVLNMN
jgi:hypothetical protein